MYTHMSSRRRGGYKSLEHRALPLWPPFACSVKMQTSVARVLGQHCELCSVPREFLVPHGTNARDQLVHAAHRVVVQPTVQRIILLDLGQQLWLVC